MHLFITGGAGFIGCNSADYFLKQRDRVTVFDNLSRPGSALNLGWLRERHGDGRFAFVEGDVRDATAVAEALAAAAPDAIIHLAGQVAVTTSVLDPRGDFEANALGTFNVLEGARLHCPEAAFIYASTNKVYGGMTALEIVEEATRYRYADRPYGIDEHAPLDFHSPYGCSKGAADQYAVDYARIYGLRTIIVRQSCIYGPRQFGVEDQGWAAHMIIAAVTGRPITIFGNGKQVRDMLHVLDLVRFYQAAIDGAAEVAGQVFNIGGGSGNSLSIWAEFGPLLEGFLGREIAVRHEDWRPGDQPVFIADTRRATARLGWQPRIAPDEGLRQVYEWVVSNEALFTPKASSGDGSGNDVPEHEEEVA